jgi:hypothetical protein
MRDLLVAVLMPVTRRERRSDASFKKVGSIYLGASCFYTFLISFVAEWRAYANAKAMKEEASLTEVWEWHTWYVGWHISLPEFHITLSRMELRYTVQFFAVVILTSCLVSLLTYYFWCKNQPRRLVVPSAIFVFSTLAFGAFLHPAALGIVLCAFCFCFLFFVGRGMNEFNPHWELAANNNALDKEKFASITKLLSQYTFTAIAAIAVIVAACFFNASTLIKDALWTQSDPRLYRVIQIPFLITTVSYGVWGCFWVSALIIRELHIKQHEVLLMPLAGSKPINSVRDASGSSHNVKVGSGR